MQKISVKAITRTNFQKKDGSLSVCIRIIANRESKQISLKHSIPVKFWDDKNECVKSGHPDASKINLLIGSYKKRVNDIVFDYNLKNKPISLNDIETELSVKRTDSFYEFWQNELDYLGNIRSSETMRTYRTELSFYFYFVLYRFCR